MKYINFSIFFILLLILCTSCGDTKKNNVIENENSEITVNKTKKKRKKKSLINKNGYWDELQKTLSLNQNQIKGLKAISTKFKKEVKILKKEKPADFKNTIVAKRKAEKLEIKQLLGDALYSKKLSFDKKWSLAKAK